MKYAHPRLCNWLVFQDAGNGTCLVRDSLGGRSYAFDNRSAWFMQQLNGRRNPYAISPFFDKHEVDHLLCYLDEHDLLRNSRVLDSGFGYVYLSLVSCPVAPPSRTLTAALNGALMSLFFPLFLLGVFMAFDSLGALGQVSVGGMVFGVATGVLLHELGHAVAGWAYGAVVHEFGISLCFLLPGAYTLLNMDDVDNRLHRAQINAAGVEMNLLLAGLYLCLAYLFPSAESFLAWAALENVVLAVMNTIFLNGLDGAHVIGDLLGSNALCDHAKVFLLNEHWRRALLSSGRQGWMKLTACALFALLQLSGIALMILNIIGGASCFLSF